MTYPLSHTKAHSWDYIGEFFSSDHGGVNSKMVDLVNHIQQSDLSKRLFGYVSILDFNRLIISIYDPIDFHKESLHIAFDTSKNTWSFNYYAKPFQDPEFVRTYSVDKGIEKFDKFISMIKW